MIKRCQSGLVLTVLTLAEAMAGSLLVREASAQAHPNRPPQHRQAPAPPTAPKPNTNRPPVQNQNTNRPPATTIGPTRTNNFNERPNGNAGAKLTPRQQLGVGAARPFVDRMRDLSPSQRENVLKSSKVFQNMPPEQQNRIRNQFNQWDKMTPQQKADQRVKENTWRSLTPEQRDHIKNDVLPKWKQMPWGRQQVMQQKLGVLQNMPESARNQRLSDPNFTRGMSEDDKAMLHDLSHLHVGGAPDPPGGEQ
jgi:Protein of unknown function (DUF3106)